MRYFVFNYTFTSRYYNGQGNRFYMSDKFPSFKQVVNEQKAKVDAESRTITIDLTLSITSVFEFKNEEDYLNAQS